MEEISEKIMGMISNVDACQNSISPHTYFIKSLKIQFCENFFVNGKKKLVSSNITRTSLKVILGNLTPANGNLF